MDATNSPTLEEIEHGLALQNQAYETLLWLDNVSLARRHVLNARTADILRKTTSCMAWVAQHRGQIPARLRPAAADEEAFARLFSSFFQTSFRIEQRLHDGKPYYRIVANKDRASGKRKVAKRSVPRRLKRMRRDEADRLKIRSLKLLDQGDETSFAAQAESILDEDTLSQDVLMWTYACELVHRAHAESHGPAAHLVWKQMDRSTRDHLSGYRIWKARERLIERLRKNENVFRTAS